MNNDEMRNIINISEGIVKNPDVPPITFKRTEQMKVKNPTGIDRFLGRGKTDDWDEYPIPKKPKHTHDHEKAHDINEHSAEQSMRDDAQEILRYITASAKASRYNSNGALKLVKKMEAITSFINDVVTKDETSEGIDSPDER